MKMREKSPQEGFLIHQCKFDRKSVIYVILIMILLIQISIPQTDVQASRYLRGPAGERVKVLLRNSETGRTVKLPVNIRYKNDPDHQIVDYEVIITSSYLKSVSKWDQTSAVKATLQMAYREKFINGVRYIAVDNYSAMWQKFDNTVSIRNSHLRSGVAGVSETGRTYSTSYQYWIGVPQLNVYYFTTPPWRGVFINMQDEVGNHGVHLYSQLVRGGSSWTLQFCIGLGQSALVCD